MMLTNKEIQKNFIRENAGKITAQDMAEKLYISTTVVFSRAREMGISLRYKRRDSVSVTSGKTKRNYYEVKQLQMKPRINSEGEELYTDGHAYLMLPCQI